eukprot:4073115-Pyramimonas_sp.AAC.1
MCIRDRFSPAARSNRAPTPPDWPSPAWHPAEGSAAIMGRSHDRSRPRGAQRAGATGEEGVRREG